jgi:PAS domain S-box-containing protein
MRRWLWLVYLAAAVLGGLAYYFFPPLAKSGPFFNILGLSSVAAIVLGIRLHRPASKLPWVLFAVGLFLFIFGDFITYNYTRLFGHDIPFPSVGDVAYLAVYPCLIAGILILIKRRSPGRDRDSLLDSLIITIGAGLYSWVFLMAPYAHDHTLSPLVKVVSIAYPMMDLLLLAVVARLVVGGGRREPAFYLLMFAAVALLVTDAAYGAIQLSGVIYQNGGPLEAGWLAFYVLWGAAALHPSMRTMDEPVQIHVPKHPKRRLAALLVASLMCPFVNILQGFRGTLLDPAMVSVCSAALFLLVFIRMNRLMVDVTKYRKTESQLRETEQKYRNLVERLPAIVYSAEFGEDGGWVYVSPQIESILGYSPEEWTSQPLLWGERVHPDDLPAALADEERVLRTGAQLLCEYRILAKDGRTVWIRDEAQPLYDDEGRATLLQGVMYDVSAAKLAELTLRRALEKEQQAASELRELHEMKNSFLHAVSHDLRTPLTSVLGSALTLNNPDLELSEEDSADLLQSITNNARKLERLLTDLLDVDRLSRGVVEPQRKRVDVRELIDRVLAECNLDHHALEVDVAPLTADVDPGHVERIVENLVSNAVRYSPQGSRIVVGCAETDGGILLSVDDSGAGVPADLRESIFEPFQQGDQRVAHSPGVGIGLSLVARFASLHGGKAWVEEADVGGASFKVLLPCTVETAGVIHEPTPERSHPAGHGPVQVGSEVGP